MYPSVITKQPRSNIRTYQSNCTIPDSLLEQIAEQGLGILPELTARPPGFGAESNR